VVYVHGNDKKVISITVNGRTTVLPHSRLESFRYISYYLQLLPGDHFKYSPCDWSHKAPINLYLCQGGIVVIKALGLIGTSRNVSLQWKSCLKTFNRWCQIAGPDHIRKKWSAQWLVSLEPWLESSSWKMELQLVWQPETLVLTSDPSCARSRSTTLATALFSCLAG